MGLFNLFSKKNNTPQKTDHYDYFAFSIKDTGLPQMELDRECKDISVKKENDCLNVYLKGKMIGSGDNQALKKFIENCDNKAWEIQSFVVYDGGRAKVRIKYYN